MGVRQGTRYCTKCGLNRRIDSKAGWRGRPVRARVCNTCSRKRGRAYNRKTHLQETYALSLGDYADLLNYQDGKCAICLTPRTYNLHVDHDHSIEDPRDSVRGLLCKADNKLLGLVRDDPERLLRAAEYLHYPPARYVLDGE